VTGNLNSVHIYVTAMLYEAGKDFVKNTSSDNITDIYDKHIPLEQTTLKKTC
jgi:hypothetical protein